MPPKTPERDDLHGGKNPDPRFTSDQAPIGYDDQTTPAGNPADPRGDGLGRGDLERKESEALDGSSTAMGSSEKSLSDQLTGGATGSGATGLYRQERPSRFKKFSGRLSKFTRRRIAVYAVSGLLAAGSIFGFSIISGPLQVLHMGQWLEKHFGSNEDFLDDRTSKVLLYSIAGKGAQNGRLGILGNYSANLWEKRLIRDAGLRPVYLDGSRRFAGFEMVDESWSRNFISDLGEVNNSKLERTMGRGADIGRGGNNPTVVRPDGTKMDEDSRFIDLRSVGFADRRVWIKSVGRSTHTYKLANALGSRLLIKRAGVNFHPMNKAKQKLDESAVKRIQKKRGEDISEGTKSTDDVKTGTVTNEEGEQVTQPEDIEATKETKSYIQDFKNSGALKTTTNSAIIIGVLCGAKTFGNSVEDYKYTNNALPMMRMGMNTATLRSQVMTGDDFDLATLGVFNQYMYDKEGKTSWNQSESIRVAQGKTGGVPISKEADLKNVSDKPALFDTLDKIPLLGFTCDTVEGFFGLPIIKQVSQGISTVTQEMADAALSLGNTSTDELFESALKVVAGKSVDPEAKGADFGNFADTGAFLASNDQAITTGATSLSSDERSELASLQEEYEAQDQVDKSFFAKAFDPYDKSSAVSTLIDNGPSSPNHLASMVSDPAKIIGLGFSNAISGIFPKAEAATVYDYGVAKYGYSQREQADPVFEDPYENAAIVEDAGNGGQLLNELNDKYGKCFGMKVTSDGIESEDKAVNVFKLEKDDDYKDCRETAGRYKNNPNDQEALLFMRYRFYLADMVTAISLACYEGDDEACSQLGVGGTTPTQEASDDLTTEPGEANIKKLKNPLPGSSCNCEIDPKGITLHWWGGQYGEGIQGLVDIFKSNGLSVQLGITSEGEIYQLTEKLTTKTSHAIGGNTTTIGIEIEGGPEQFGKDGIEKYPEKFEAVVATVQYLKDKYNIPLRKNVVCDNASGILQHSDFNKCPGAIAKSDIDDYYYNEVVKRVR
jgi:hypothetical protein